VLHSYRLLVFIKKNYTDWKNLPGTDTLAYYNISDEKMLFNIDHRFGDTAANVGILMFLQPYDLPLPIK
jgi:hypothetical protein